MGITGAFSRVFPYVCIDTCEGLLPALKSIQKPCHLKDFQGQTVAIDAYGWLHKGTGTCVVDLVLEKPTRKYVVVIKVPMEC